MPSNRTHSTETGRPAQAVLAFFRKNRRGQRAGHRPEYRLVVLALLIAALLGTASTGWAAEGQPEAESVLVPMRDGVLLATDVYRPDEPGSYPVVLSRTPYNKEGLAGMGRDGARRGYVVVTQDTRGRFASQGENLPFNLEGPDGQDTLAWITSQPWCNGKVGTVGGSAGAIVQYPLAPGAGDPLVAQYLVVGGANLYEIVYLGGIFRRALIEDWLKVTKFAPEALQRWAGHPRYDQYWAERDTTLRLPEIDVAAVHVGGYWDIFAQATVQGFQGYQNHGGTRARGQQKLLLGPWTHGVLQTKAGQLEFRRANAPPGQLHDSWSWFDHYLRGRDNGIERLPAVTYYQMGDVFDDSAPGNQWRTADTWPPAGFEPKPFYLLADQRLSSTGGDAAGQVDWTYDPADPAPTVGGMQLTLPAGPMDQQAVESRGDVVLFTSPALSEPLEVTGQVAARLWVSSDATDTDFFVRLCDVYPDGRSFNLCEGMLRARFREGFDREVALVPGEAALLEFELGPTSIVLAPGHRLRVQITSSCAPGFAVSGNRGPGEPADAPPRPARNAIHWGSMTPSCVLLPVRP